MSSSRSYAGFWIRFVAIIIDYLLIGLLSAFVIVPVLGAFGIMGSVGDMDAMDESFMAGMLAAVTGTMALVNIVVNWLYFALMESSAWQATLGKRAVGVKVIGDNGGRISFITATIRYVGKIVSGAILLIGYIMAAFSAKKQALHDLIASTFVVKA
jgi:uncharacterized RDD family membrane protein YckC